MIIKARKKPVVIQALQFAGSNLDEVKNFVSPEYFNLGNDGILSIYEYVMGQWQEVPVDAYIIKGTKGEFYACAQEVFVSIYDIVPESAANAAE